MKKSLIFSLKKQEVFSVKPEELLSLIKTRGKLFGTVNIDGIEVVLTRVETRKEVWFNAYAFLKNSSAFNDSFLCYPTLREGDIVGVDTMHSFNDNMNEAQKLLSAISQIESVIKEWKRAVQGVD